MDVEHFDEDHGILHIKDERIQPEDYDKGLVRRIRFSMDRLEHDFTEFLFVAASDDVDLELAMFTVLTAIDALKEQGQISEHLAETIGSLGGTIYKAMKHNEEVSDERHTASAE